RHRPLHQLDIKNALEQPPGFVAQGESSNMVYRLHKSFYGLKQSLRAWFGRFSIVVQQFGMVRSEADHYVFYRHPAYVLHFCPEPFSTFIPNLLLLSLLSPHSKRDPTSGHPTFPITLDLPLLLATYFGECMSLPPLRHLSNPLLPLKSDIVIALCKDIHSTRNRSH
ncbi:unnamed protein product, partial [Vicia faba]